MATGELTTAQVNKAGRTIRRFFRDRDIEEAEYVAALEILLTFRVAHRLPLVSATMGLRSCLNSEGLPARDRVSQRLKRVPTIIDKLTQRETTLQLANMQDIGGCRAIVDTIPSIRRIQRRIERNHLKRTATRARVSDYIEQPRDTGYRGVHVIVVYRGRRLEVQLRTRVMHEWAIAVERLGGNIDEDLKGGKGPPELLRAAGGDLRGDGTRGDRDRGRCCA